MVEANSQAFQILLQWLPQCGVVVGVGDVEDQALAGAQEIDVEHGGQLSGGQLGRAGEEAPGEDLEREVSGRLGKVDALQERLGVDVVEPMKDVGQRHRGKWCGGPRVDPGQVGEPESRAAQGEYQRIPRRCAGQATERVPTAGAVDEWVIVDRGQHRQRRIDAAQQRPQVVVLPEERVKAAVHGEIRAVDVLGPSTDPSAEVLLALDDVDPDATFGETRCGGKARDSGADDDDARLRRQRLGVAQALRRRKRAAMPVGHDGAFPRKVCAMLASQPGMVSLRTDVNPASRIRCRNRVTPSKVNTLRHRCR